MTTVEKRRGLRAWIADWLYPEIQAKDEAVREALIWEATYGKISVPCVKCKQAISAQAAYCSACGWWQEEASRAAGQETQPIPSITLGDERLYFKPGRTGDLQLEGKRPREAYIEKWRALIEKDQWLLK